MSEPLLTAAEFAQAIKAKYPDYASVSDAELAAKMLEKYPEYRTRVQQPPTPPSMSAAMRGTALPALPGADDPNEVTLGDLIEDPGPALQRIGANLKRDASDPSTWLSLAAAYFGPKVIKAAIPAVSRAAAATARSVGQVANADMVRDVATVGLGDGRVNAGLRIGSRLADAVRRAPEPVAAPTTTSEPAAVVPPIVDEFTAARSARTAAAAPPAAAEPIVAASGKMQLTAAEMKEFTRLLKKKMPAADALTAVMQMRELAAKLGGATPADVAKAVAQRDRTGHW